MKRPKYGNRKVTVDGFLFDSVKESIRWGELKLLARAGEISKLERQVVYPLQVGGMMICKYKADFRYVENGKTVVEDSKGAPPTDVFKLKAKLMKAIHGVEIKIT